MKKSDIFKESLNVSVILSMLCYGFSIDEIAEAQGVPAAVVEWLNGYMWLYKEYRQTAKNGEYEKIQGYTEKMANLWRSIPICA